MGVLHIEESLLCIRVQLNEGSDLAEILSLHNFSTIGLSVITDASHIKKVRYAIQVTLRAIFSKYKKLR